MPRRDTIDFLTAFAIGAVVGVGATLLLRPDVSRTERILRDLKPYGKQLRRSARDARTGFTAGAGATAEMADTLRDASRTLLRDFRSEVADLVATARDDLAHAIDQQVAGAQRGVERRIRRMGRS